MIVNSNIKIRWNCDDDFKLLGIIFDVDMYSMVKTIYDNAFKKTFSLIKIWLRHNVTVLPCLIIMSTPLCEDDIMSNVNSLLFRFV